MAIGSPSTVDLLYPSVLSPCRRTPHSPSRESPYPGASDPSSTGRSSTSPSVSGLLQLSLSRPEGFGVVAPHHWPLDPVRLVTSSHFHMETPQSVLRSIRPGGWMVSLDLQVPVHHDSRRYLRFVVGGRTY